MCGVGQYALSAARLKRLGRFAQRACGVHHIIHQNAGAVLNVANNVHHLRLIRPRAPLIDDGQLHVKLLGHCARADNAANVWGHNDDVVIVLTLNVI